MNGVGGPDPTMWRLSNSGGVVFVLIVALLVTLALA